MVSSLLGDGGFLFVGDGNETLLGGGETLLGGSVTLLGGGETLFGGGETLFGGEIGGATTGTTLGFGILISPRLVSSIRSTASKSARMASRASFTTDGSSFSTKAS